MMRTFLAFILGCMLGGILFSMGSDSLKWFEGWRQGRIAEVKAKASQCDQGQILVYIESWVCIPGKMPQ